jgi:hypothetical protein
VERSVDGEPAAVVSDARSGTEHVSMADTQGSRVHPAAEQGEAVDASWRIGLPPKCTAY